MDSWQEASAELPTVDEIVEVCVGFGQGGSMHLRGYRLSARAGGESLWLNALTHEPFPQGWQVIRWRRADGQMVQHAMAGTPGGSPKSSERL